MARGRVNMVNARPWILSASVLLHLLAGAALWTRQVDEGGSPATRSQPQRIAVRLLPTVLQARPDSPSLTTAKPTLIRDDTPRTAPPMPMPMQTAMTASTEPVTAASPAAAVMAALSAVPQPQTAAIAAAAPDQAPQQAAAVYRTVALPADHRACSERSVSRLYPAMLSQRGIEGQVLLRVLVDENGHASAVQVQQGSGWRLLDEAARLVAQACPFVPARRGDQNLASWVEYPVRFSLNPQLQ
jgi:periplasmic protein TonB